jgi:hypothetical protein
MFELLLFGVDVQRNDTIILLFVPSICSPFFSARIPRKKFSSRRIRQRGLFVVIECENLLRANPDIKCSPEVFWPIFAIILPLASANVCSYTTVTSNSSN